MLSKSQQVEAVLGTGLSVCQRSWGTQGKVAPSPCHQNPPCSFTGSAQGGSSCLSKSEHDLFARKYLRALENILKTERVKELAGVPGAHQELEHFIGPTVT